MFLLGGVVLMPWCFICGGCFGRGIGKESNGIVGFCLGGSDVCSVLDEEVGNGNSGQWW